MMLSTRCLSGAAMAAAMLIGMAPPSGLANPYVAVQTQDNAEFAIANGYIVKQMGCTPDMPPVFESVTWNPPGFTPGGGSGVIHDANPALGGAFAIRWAGDFWDVEYQFC